MKENAVPLEDLGTIHGAALKLTAYQASLNRLKGIVLRRALVTAAKKEGLAVEDYLKKY